MIPQTLSMIFDGAQISKLVPLNHLFLFDGSTPSQVHGSLTISPNLTGVPIKS